MSHKESILYVWLPCKKIYPIGPTYLANYIHTHHPEVRQKILDLSVIERKERLRILKETIDSFKPELIAFSWRDIQIFAPHEGDSSLKYAFEFYYSPSLIKRIRASFKGLEYIYRYRSVLTENLGYIRYVHKGYPGKRLILGGGAPSVFSKQIIRMLPEGVTCIMGEGEEALLKIMEGRDLLDERYIERGDGGVIIGEKMRPVSIDEFKIDLKYVSSIFDQYASYRGDLIGVQTKRGCPYSCQFCLYTYIEGKKVRYRRPENIIDEISQFYHQWAVKKFWFSDAQFIPGVDAIPVCKELLERLVLSKMDISWSGYIRASLIDMELARLMVRSGLGDLEVSITSGSQREIDALKMGFKIDELMGGLRNLKEAGFKGRLLLNYSLNSPDADIDTVKESIASYKKISEMMGADMVFPFIFFYGIQPNTGFEKRLIESGYIPRGYNPLSLNPFTVRKLLYNPPPLDRLIAKALLSAWEDGGQDVGKDAFKHLEDEIRKVSRPSPS
jgi:radical SAM superfamily enzyme YgiQ (UPF0313 family)